MDEAPDAVASAVGAVTYETGPWQKHCSGALPVQLMSAGTLRPIFHFMVHTRTKPAEPDRFSQLTPFGTYRLQSRKRPRRYSNNDYPGTFGDIPAPGAGV